MPVHYWPGGDIPVTPALVTGGGAGMGRAFHPDSEIVILLLAAALIKRKRYHG